VKQSDKCKRVACSLAERSLILITVVILFSLNSALAQQRSDEEPYLPIELRSLQLSDYEATPATLLTPAELDSLIEAKMASFLIAGVAAVIVKDSNVVWEGYYGYASTEDSIEVADTTLFVLASISKSVVATAVMQLYENGLLDKQIHINNYLPFEVNNPNHPDSIITFPMLLAHVSSIADLADSLWSDEDSIYIEWGGDHPEPLGEHMQSWLVPGGSWYAPDHYIGGSPGSTWYYSNPGAALAGYLVEAITGMSFEQYCQDSIFIPLGITETSWFLSELNIDNVAIPYWVSGAPNGHFGLPIYPAAQLRTSARQLARHMMAVMLHGELNGTRILEAATVNYMLRHHYPDVVSNQGFGYSHYQGTDIHGVDYNWWRHDGGMHGPEPSTLLIMMRTLVLSY